MQPQDHERFAVNELTFSEGGKTEDGKFGDALDSFDLGGAPPVTSTARAAQSSKIVQLMADSDAAKAPAAGAPAAAARSAPQATGAAPAKPGFFRRLWNWLMSE